MTVHDYVPNVNYFWSRINYCSAYEDRGVSRYPTWGRHFIAKSWNSSQVLEDRTNPWDFTPFSLNYPFMTYFLSPLYILSKNYLKQTFKKLYPSILYIYTHKISKLASSGTFLSCFFSLLSLTWKGLHRAQFMFYELAIHFLALTVPLDSGISIYYGII